MAVPLIPPCSWELDNASPQIVLDSSGVRRRFRHLSGFNFRIQLGAANLIDISGPRESDMGRSASRLKVCRNDARQRQQQLRSVTTS